MVSRFNSFPQARVDNRPVTQIELIKFLYFFIAMALPGVYISTQ